LFLGGFDIGKVVHLEDNRERSIPSQKLQPNSPLGGLNVFWNFQDLSGGRDLYIADLC
jgi:hypothetical protein